MGWLYSRTTALLFVTGFIVASLSTLWVLERRAHKTRALAASALNEKRIAELKHVIGPVCSSAELRESVERNKTLSEITRTDAAAIVFARAVAATLPPNVTEAVLEAEASR